MPPKAQVTALDALEAFRSRLIIYVSQARPAVEEVTAEAVRFRVWLESDHRVHWENQKRRRLKRLEEAQQALFSARLGTLRHETAQDQLAVHRAKQAVEEADAKLRTMKRWSREFDGRVQPLVKQMEKLHTVLSTDMVKAIAYLAQTVDILSAYAEVAPPGSVETPPAAESEPSPSRSSEPALRPPPAA